MMKKEKGGQYSYSYVKMTLATYWGSEWTWDPRFGSLTGPSAKESILKRLSILSTREEDARTTRTATLVSPVEVLLVDASPAMHRAGIDGLKVTK
jgi:hypothetical protein